MKRLTAAEAQVVLDTVPANTLSTLFRLTTAAREHVFDRDGGRCRRCGAALEWGAPKGDPAHPEIAHVPALSAMTAEQLSRYTHSDPTTGVELSCHDCNSADRGRYVEAVSRPTTLAPLGPPPFVVPEEVRGTYLGMGLVVASQAPAIIDVFRADAAAKRARQGWPATPSGTPLAVTAADPAAAGERAAARARAAMRARARRSAA